MICVVRSSIISICNYTFNVRTYKVVLTCFFRSQNRFYGPNFVIFLDFDKIKKIEH